MDPIKEELLKDVNAFEQHGFRMVDKDSMNKDYTDHKYDPSTPDIVMVRNGNTANTTLKHGIACIHAKGRRNTFIHTALSSATEQSKLDALSRMGSVFYKITDGTHVGCIPVCNISDRTGVLGGSEPASMSFNDTLEKIKKLNLDTVNLPMEDLCFIPFFGKDNCRTHNLTEEQLIKCLASNLGDQIGVMSMSNNQIDIALSHSLHFNEQKLNNDTMSPREHMRSI
jgi:hypothetical protein